MPTLRAIDIDIHFGGLHALISASIDVPPGKVTGLIGPNGAGKTTLFNVVTGLLQPNGGSVIIEEDDGSVIDLTRKPVHRRTRAGIARTFQKLEAFNTLSVCDNVLVAAEMKRRWDRSGPSPDEEVDAILDRVGIADVADVTVGTLPTGTARLVELAHALASGPRFLLLDEPSSGLNEEETVDMGKLLRRLVDDGLAVLLVEHDMSFVMSLCEHIDVLEFGQVIARGTPTEIQHDPQVQAAYLGDVHGE